MSNYQVLLLSGQIIGMLHGATAEELEAAAECLKPSYRRLTLELARMRRILEHLRDDGTVDGEDSKEPQAAPEFWHLFHHLWGKATEVPGYDKQEWVKMEAAIGQALQSKEKS